MPVFLSEENKSCLVPMGCNGMRMRAGWEYVWKGMIACTGVVALTYKGELSCGHFSQGDNHKLTELLINCDWAYILHHKDNPPEYIKEGFV